MGVTKTPTFAARLRAAIAAAEMTREAVAEKSGIGLDTLYKLLAGTRVPNSDTLAKLCRALGVSADELLGL